jgi:hypothetical protein
VAQATTTVSVVIQLAMALDDAIDVDKEVRFELPERC